MTQDEMDDFVKLYEEHGFTYAQLYSLYVMPKVLDITQQFSDAAIMYVVGEIKNGITKEKLETIAEEIKIGKKNKSTKQA